MTTILSAFAGSQSSNEAQAQAYCFGRFVISIPAATHVHWETQSTPLHVEIGRGQTDQIDDAVLRTEAEMRARRLMWPRGEENAYLATRKSQTRAMVHVIGYGKSTEIYRVVNSWLRLDGALVYIGGGGLADELERSIADIEAFAHRLRLRNNTDIPTDPGQCIDNGFVRDESATDPVEPVSDQINIGFRLKHPAGVHLSISITNAVDNRRFSPTLGQQLDDSENPLQRLTGTSPFSGLKVFRRKPRDIGDWKGGFEFLTRVPPSQEAPYGSHDFWYRYTGRERDRLHPHVEIRMFTGLPKDDSSSRREKPSLTDAQAVALWNQLTGSIRPRPVKSPVAR